MPSSYATIKARREADPEYAARLKSYAEKYKNNNQEKEKERQRNAKRQIRSKDKESYNAYMREWARKNASELNAKRREKRQTDPERTRKDNERRKSQHDPVHHRNLMLKNNYGISLEDYHQRYKDQDGKCLICSKSCPDNGSLGLVVDHCHTKGHVRGLLCAHCNHGLGKFKDDVQLLQKAIEYLKERG